MQGIGKVTNETDRISAEYVGKVINCLLKDEFFFYSDRRREVSEQVEALKCLIGVIEARLRPSTATLFDTSLDDDEEMLHLMFEIDKAGDRNGSISKNELFESLLLTKDENQEIANVFRSIFECSVGMMEEALMHLKEEDFGEFKPEQQGQQEVARLVST